MNNLRELEKQYEELGKEIERLKKEQEPARFKDDPIFLLSEEEYEKYKDKIPKIGCWWWLRSPSMDSGRAVNVNYVGSLSVLGYDVACDGAVRPALRTSNLKLGKEFKSTKPPVFVMDEQRSVWLLVFNGVTWVQIDDGLYISELPIDFRRFDEKSNNYETSEVRKFLLYWFEERQDLN